MIVKISILQKEFKVLKLPIFKSHKVYTIINTKVNLITFYADQDV